jgi:hypothetical protein
MPSDWRRLAAHWEVLIWRLHESLEQFLAAHHDKKLLR